MSHRIVTITAGLSQPSTSRLLADRLTEATLAELGRDATGSVVELRDVAHDITNALLTGFPAGGLADLVEELRGADAVIMVTPIFNATFSGLFKSFLDALEPDLLAGTPVLLGATGGTARHSLALEFGVRPLFAYLHVPVVPTAVFAATADFGATGEEERDATVWGPEPQMLTQRVRQAARELADAVRHSPRVAPLDPFEHPVDFNDLLAE